MLELDIISQNSDYSNDEKWYFEHLNQMMVLLIQLALYEFRKSTIIYLNTGTGYACARHKRPKLWLTSRLNVMLLASVENVGAFEPTGSK